MIGRAESELLAMVLSQQDDPEDFDRGAFELAVADCLRRGQPLPPAMARAVWHVPGARAAYLGLRRAHARRLRQAWNDNGFALRAERRAASTQAARQSVLASGWSVQILRSPASGQTLVSLEMEPRAASLLPPGTRVRISDGGGMVWLEGTLDGFGGIDAEWPHDELSPEERLRHHALTISFA
jgi:hypothetical protein